MDIGKRLSEGACVICALAAIYEFGDKHKWWPTSWPNELGSYVLPVCVLIACAACFYMSRRLTQQKRLTDESFSKYSTESREHGETRGALRDMTTYRDQALKQRNEAITEKDNLQVELQVAINNAREDREETVRWKQRTATLEQELDRRLQEQAEHLETQGKIWSLKQSARDLRRRGADPLFLARPLDRLLWLDQVHPDAKWREDAVKWYEAVRQTEFAKGPLQEILPTLDFDELMEELDEHERKKRGQTASWMYANPEEPRVLIMNQLEQVEKRYGAWLCNYGSTTARQVRILPIRIGRFLFTFDEVQFIPSGNRKEFTQATALEMNGTRWMDLTIESSLAAHPDCAPEMLTFFVEYLNTQGHRLRTRHQGRMSGGKLVVSGQDIRQY
jgi:hypothetical protein